MVPRKNGTDMCFTRRIIRALESALERAIGLWYQYPDQFRQLMLNAMRRLLVERPGGELPGNLRLFVK